MNPNFIKNFDQLIQSIGEQSEAAWLSELRRQSLSYLTQTGLPTTKDEEWKYTNVAPVTKQTYTLASQAKILDIPPLNNYIDTKEINIVLVNGKFNAPLSNLKAIPKGVKISSLNEAYKTEGSLIKNVLHKHNTEQDGSFTALNHVLADEGTFIKIDPNTVSPMLIHIVHITHSKEDRILTIPRTFIALGRSSEAVILETHMAPDDTSVYFTNALTDIFMEENSTLRYCKSEKESLLAYHVGQTRVWQERNSSYDGFVMDTGASLVRNSLNIVLNGERASSVLNGLYSIRQDQHVDNHTSVDHRFPNCTSNQLYKGILNDASRAVFNGKVFVRQAAQLTNSYQLNKNLLLGKNCRVDTKPQLEIFADDVKCTHGATIGQLEENELFYLQTRAIGRKTAVKMLAHGFVDDVLNTVKTESINHKLHQLIGPSLMRLEE